MINMDIVTASPALHLLAYSSIDGLSSHSEVRRVKRSHDSEGDEMLVGGLGNIEIHGAAWRRCLHVLAHISLHKFPARLLVVRQQVLTGDQQFGRLKYEQGEASKHGDQL